MAYRYYYLARPPGLGCQPRGYLRCEAWLPARHVNECLCFGWVEYEQPLSDEEAWRYDLVPEGQVVNSA